ncbi:MAG: DUF6527 family protein [Sideroxyarcus sp.]|nr:DUF6527 family protein [Sideroxyarcus sp.]
MSLPVWLRCVLERFLPTRTLTILQGDALPEKLPWRGLLLLRDGGEDWCVGLKCPCGCRQRIELPLIKEANPRWKLRVEPDGTPTLVPSVWLQDGCRSHFFVRCGKVEWV